MPYVISTSFDRRDIQTDRVEEFYHVYSDALEDYHDVIGTAERQGIESKDEFRTDGWLRTSIVFKDLTSMMVEIV